MFNNTSKGTNMANTRQVKSAGAIRLPETGFVRLQTILSIIPISRSTWWYWVKAGRAPKPIRLGPRTTVYRVEDIRAMIDSAA